MGLPQSGDTSSEAADVNLGDIPEPVFIDGDPGPVIDAEINGTPGEPQERKPVFPFGNRRREDTSEPKRTPPNANEWLDFFSRIILRFATEFYIEFRFRGIDESLISDEDAERLLMTEEERDTIARPFAEYANKNPFLKKHGREIVALADSFESMVMLAQWYRRVDRVARKYQPKKTVPGRVTHHEHNGQSQAGAASENGQRAGFSIFNPGTS